MAAGHVRLGFCTLSPPRAGPQSSPGGAERRAPPGGLRTLGQTTVRIQFNSKRSKDTPNPHPLGEGWQTSSHCRRAAHSSRNTLYTRWSTCRSPNTAQPRHTPSNWKPSRSGTAALRALAGSQRISMRYKPNAAKP